jgi:GT2 family glycosyltransferase
MQSDDKNMNTADAGNSGALQAPYFSVCIITYRRPDLLAKCLERIAPGRQTLDAANYEVVVSDDCPEGSARQVVANGGFARWVKGPEQGVAANRNNAAQAARGEWIVFVDDDELPEPDWLEKLHEAAVSGTWDVIEGRVEPVDYPDSVFWYAPTVRQGGLFCTANLAIRRELLVKLGGFDQRLRVSHEDVELGGRIVASGCRTTFQGDAVVYHPARKSTFRQGWAKAVQQQYQTYRLNHGIGGDRPAKPLHVLTWSFKYLYRTFRIQWAVVGVRRWRRFLCESVLRVLCCPAASLKLLSRGARNETLDSDQRIKLK